MAKVVELPLVKSVSPDGEIRTPECTLLRFQVSCTHEDDWRSLPFRANRRDGYTIVAVFEVKKEIPNKLS